MSYQNAAMLPHQLHGSLHSSLGSSASCAIVFPLKFFLKQKFFSTLAQVENASKLYVEPALSHFHLTI
jgi:hypothetical protein